MTVLYVIFKKTILSFCYDSLRTINQKLIMNTK